jgi:imidazolonepropionase-like amidohydrolase
MFHGLALGLLTFAFGSGAQTTPREPPAAIAFVDVDVAPMDRERLLRRQTVVVKGDRIVAIGPAAEVAVPEGALRIEGRIAGRDGGRARYLMPGLADMHVHAWDPDDLVLFLANGVTTVRNMFGSPMHLEWRAKIAAGELLGPTILTAGPIIDGNPPVWPGSTVVDDPALAEKAVLEQKEAGYDFLKVYARLTLPCYDAIVEAAAKHGMRVMGHVPAAVGLAHVLASKQESVEHLDGMAGFAQKDDSPYFSRVDFQNEALAWKHVDDAKIAQAAKIARENGVWSCPTIVVLQKWVQGDAAKALFERPEMKFVPAIERAAWDPGNNYLKSLPVEYVDSVRAADPDRKRAVGILHKAGARILLGTDMGNPFVMAGFAVHEELENLVACGLTPFEALRAGTSGAAEFMKAGSEWGSVTVGSRADLLLLEGDPLEDVRNAARRVGVMVRGQWFSESDLRARLEELAMKNEAARSSMEPTPK